MIYLRAQDIPSHSRIIFLISNVRVFVYGLFLFVMVQLVRLRLKILLESLMAYMVAASCRFLLPFSCICIIYTACLSKPVLFCYWFKPAAKYCG